MRTHLALKLDVGLIWFPLESFFLLSDLFFRIDPVKPVPMAVRTFP